jgi:hypothetical protein
MGVPFNLISENRINAEQYYNETYGGDKWNTNYEHIFITQLWKVGFGKSL